MPPSSYGVHHLGKKGDSGDEDPGSLSAEERPQAGALINAAKDQVQGCPKQP
jgi:phenylalanyl-tRNA synthetase alpha chain